MKLSTIIGNSTLDEHLKWLQLVAKKHNCPFFEPIEMDLLPISMLLIYFLQDNVLAEKNSMNLNKGLILSGPIGCGKTTLMRMFSTKALENGTGFIIKPTRDIVNEFSEAGRITIQRYTVDLHMGVNRQVYASKNYCFDDLGIESSINHYGNEINVMEEILTARYDLKRLKTHITTNLNTLDLEAKYGKRLSSRMKEMFNVVYFNSPDKRV